MAQLLNAAEPTAREPDFRVARRPLGRRSDRGRAPVEADLRGVHSHGVIRVPTYVEGTKAGRINPRPKLEVVEDHGGQVVMDGDYGPVRLTALRANELAIARGKEHGMAAVALRRSTHCGA